MLLQVTCPDEVNIESLLETMVDDFFYGNRESEEFGPHMDSIRASIIDSGIEKTLV
jgi:hypothetical protein